MSQCKSCQAQIVFVKTPKGRHMPCDVELADWPGGTVVDTMGNVLTDGGRGYRPHWATCPDAKKHRRSNQTTLFEP